MTTGLQIFLPLFFFFNVAIIKERFSLKQNKIKQKLHIQQNRDEIPILTGLKIHFNLREKKELPCSIWK